MRYPDLFRLLRHSTHFEISIRIMECPEESECSENFDLESIIGEEVHEGKESEVWCEGESATWASWEDSPDDSTDSSDSWLMMEVFLMSELESLVEHSDKKKWKSYDHQEWEDDVSIGMNWSIIPEHNPIIGERPPDISSEDHKEDKSEYECRISKWFLEVGKHNCGLMVSECSKLGWSEIAWNSRFTISPFCHSPIGESVPMLPNVTDSRKREWQKYGFFVQENGL